jgi:ketosteroid isomerase-like protein
MDRDDALDYARRWADAWSRRDLDAVLGHFAADVVFASPKALQVVGAPVVRGKDALRAYWEKALGDIKSIRFTVVRVVWDPDTAELAIIYDRDVDGRRDRAAEMLRFGASGQVVSGEVLYGVVP